MASSDTQPSPPKACDLCNEPVARGSGVTIQDFFLHRKCARDLAAVLQKVKVTEEIMSSDSIAQQEVVLGRRALDIAALLSPGIKAILIKGRPGTGKTTLALELLKIAGGGLYISTQVPLQRMVAQAPSLQPLLKKGEIVQTNVGSSAEKLRFEDTRFATATDIVESVLDTVRRSNKPLIVLDSWDSIAKKLQMKDRLKMENSLVSIVDESDSKVLFLSEEPELTTTDYLVDAVVTLKDLEFEGRRMRLVEWEKLRGAAIPQKSYLFTLHVSKFTMFRRTKVLGAGEYRARQFPPRENPEGFFSTGSKDLDDFLGKGLRRGSTVLIELGRNIGSNWHLPLHNSIRFNMLTNGGCAVSMPTGGLTPEMIIESILPHIPEEMLTSQLRVGSYEPTTSKYTYMLDMKSLAGSFDAFWKQVDAIKGEQKRPCYMFMGIDTLEYLFHNKDALLEHAINAIHRVKFQNDIMVMLAKHATRSNEELSDLCDVRLRLEEVGRTLVLYASKPPSELFHVEYDYSDGYPKVSLVPIV